MAVYAMNTGRAFIAKGELKRKTKVTPETQARNKWMRDHKVSIYTDDKTGEVVVRVEKREP